MVLKEYLEIFLKNMKKNITNTDFRVKTFKRTCYKNSNNSKRTGLSNCFIDAIGASMVAA